MAEGKLRLVGCLNVCLEPSRGDALHQSWMQRGFAFLQLSTAWAALSHMVQLELSSFTC